MTGPERCDEIIRLIDEVLLCGDAATDESPGRGGGPPGHEAGLDMRISPPARR